MEIASGLNSRSNAGTLNREKNEEYESFNIENFESESLIHSQPVSCLEILRESVRILRQNSSPLLSIVALLICPVSAVFLSNVLVNETLVKWLSLRLLLLAKSSGLPLEPFVHRFCLSFSDITISIATCFPLFMTFLLLSKTVVVYSVNCAYSKKTFDQSVFYVFISKIWKRILLTYLLSCGVICGCFVLFIVFLGMASSLFLIMGCPSDLLLYPIIVVGLILVIFLANAMVICNIAVVISILEDAMMLHALQRSSSLVRRQYQVGLSIFLGSTLGMAFIEGLFDHRVKTLSYGDGFSRIWEAPLLVVMFSFVLLIDSLMNTIFYFSCKAYSLEFANEEIRPVLEARNVATELNHAP